MMAGAIQCLDRREFLNQLDAFDAAAAVTPSVARCCSSSIWTVAADSFLHAGRDLRVYRKGDDWCALAYGDAFDHGSALQPLEVGWGFASPLVGARLDVQADLFKAALGDLDGHEPFTLLGGIHERLTVGHALRKAVKPPFRFRFIPATDCLTASLAGGEAGFLSRRSPKFRASLRNAARRAASAGITFERVAPDRDSAPAVFERLLAIDHATWKSKAGEGVFNDPEHRAFYRDVFLRASGRGLLSCFFAVKEGRDVGYLFGVVFGNTFRGFQMGYATDWRRLGIGNLLQMEAVKFAALAGIPTYDLGMETDYKARWAENRLELFFVLVQRH